MNNEEIAKLNNKLELLTSKVNCIYEYLIDIEVGFQKKENIEKICELQNTIKNAQEDLCRLEQYDISRIIRENRMSDYPRPDKNCYTEW